MDRLGWVKRILLLGALLLGLVVWTVNCGENSSKESKTTPKSSGIPVKRADIVLAYDGWSGTYLPIYVLKIILEENLLEVYKYEYIVLFKIKERYKKQGKVYQ